jgi:hypothetical protein
MWDCTAGRHTSLYVEADEGETFILNKYTQQDTCRNQSDKEKKPTHLPVNPREYGRIVEDHDNDDDDGGGGGEHVVDRKINVFAYK